MIYNFELKDKRKDRFLEILKESGIDYEVTEHDHTVVRVLGNLSGVIKEKIDFVSGSRQSLRLNRPAEIDCYKKIIERKELTIIAGPCAVEDEEQLAKTAAFLSRRGVKFLRGGAFKPRTSSDSFQGMGKPGLELLRKYAGRLGMYVVTEVMDRSQIDLVAEYADILQIGSRNMYNYTLLTALGGVNRPILLKRGMAATIDEWLESARYVSRGGNNSIILCERGIRTFEPKTAHTLDLAAIWLAKENSPFPVIADSSHAAGRPDLVSPLACAAVAAGADGIMVEIHPEPDRALSDGKQALTFDLFEKLQEQVSRIYAARENR